MAIYTQSGEKVLPVYGDPTSGSCLVAYEEKNLLGRLTRWQRVDSLHADGGTDEIKEAIRRASERYAYS